MLHLHRNHIETIRKPAQRTGNLWIVEKLISIRAQERQLRNALRRASKKQATYLMGRLAELNTEVDQLAAVLDGSRPRRLRSSGDGRQLLAS